MQNFKDFVDLKLNYYLKNLKCPIILHEWGERSKLSEVKSIRKWHFLPIHLWMGGHVSVCVFLCLMSAL
jgi:hypothetical protein